MLQSFLEEDYNLTRMAAPVSFASIIEHNPLTILLDNGAMYSLV